MNADWSSLWSSGRSCGAVDDKLVRSATARTPEDTMGLDDKIKNTAQDLTGKGKEAVGKATDDESLEAEGHADQAKADVKKAGEDVKDTFR
jgi:uncharacterized protein YjbJ (UPF0337 family)